MTTSVMRKSIEFCQLFVALGELVQVRRRFQQVARSRVRQAVDRDHFIRLFAIAPDLADHVFNLFDYYKRNTISYNNFLLALSVFTNSTNQEKVDLVWDIFCSGSAQTEIHRPELIYIVDLIINNAFNLMGVNVHDPAYILAADTRAKRIVDSFLKPSRAVSDLSVPFGDMYDLVDVHDTFCELRVFVLETAVQAHSLLRACPEPYLTKAATSEPPHWSDSAAVQRFVFPEFSPSEHGSRAIASLARVLRGDYCAGMVKCGGGGDGDPPVVALHALGLEMRSSDERWSADTELERYASSDPERYISLQGYVYKQTWFLRRMRRRWVVLSNNMLYSFHSRSSAKPNLVLSLLGAVCKPVENSSTKFLSHFRPLFALQLSPILCDTTRIIYLPSAKLRDQWLEAIRIASREFILAEHYQMCSLVHPCLPNVFRCRGAYSERPYMLRFIDKLLVNDADLNALRIESGTLRFADHPDIATTVAQYEDRSKVYIVRHYIPNWVRLDEIISAGGILSVNSVGLILRQILSGLQFLAQHRLALGAFCPANVVLCLDRLYEHRVQLVDVGLRHFFVAMLEPSTRSYLAPEVNSGSSFGPKADMWSVGAIVYRLLTPGSTNDDLMAAQRGDLDLTRTIGSVDVIRMLKRLMSRNPSRRYCPTDSLHVDFIANADAGRRFELRFPKRVFQDQFEAFRDSVMTMTTTATTTMEAANVAVGQADAAAAAAGDDDDDEYGESVDRRRGR